MSVAMVEPEPQSGWSLLVSTLYEMEIPEGFRAEISEGAIRVTPPPAGPHSLVADVLNRLFVTHAPPDAGVFQSVGLKLDELERLYLPDLVVLPRSALRVDGTASPDAALIVVEITSPSTARFDREEKRWAYARGGVNAYLLVDRIRSSGPAVTLHTRPEHGQFQGVTQVPYGEKITLPPPFDVDLDTAEFPVDPV